MAHYRTPKHLIEKLAKVKSLYGNPLEVQASVIIQDLTYKSKAGKPELGNFMTVEYTGGAVAGAEVVTVTNGKNISVQIETGVSTATQVKAAVDGHAPAAALVDVTITGTAGDAQVVESAKTLSGGLKATPQRKKNFVFKYKPLGLKIDGKDMTNVDFESNGGLEVSFDYDGSTYSFAKTDIRIVDRLRSKKYSVEPTAVTIV